MLVYVRKYRQYTLRLCNVCMLFRAMEQAHFRPVHKLTFKQFNFQITNILWYLAIHNPSRIQQITLSAMQRFNNIRTQELNLATCQFNHSHILRHNTHLKQVNKSKYSIIKQSNKTSIQPLNYSTTQLFIHSTIQPLNYSTTQLFNRSTIQPLNYSTTQLFNHSTIQPLNYSTT